MVGAAGQVAEDRPTLQLALDALEGPKQRLVTDAHEGGLRMLCHVGTDRDVAMRHATSTRPTASADIVQNLHLRVASRLDPLQICRFFSLELALDVRNKVCAKLRTSLNLPSGPNSPMACRAFTE